MGYNPLFCSAYRKLREEHVSLDVFRECIKRAIPNMNHENDALLIKMFSRYVDFFKTLDHSKKKQGRLPAIIGGWFGFESRTTTLQFYLDRGWDLVTAKVKLKERQAVGSVESVAKRWDVSTEEAKTIVAASSSKGSATLRRRSDYADMCWSKGNANRFEYYLDQINPNTQTLYTELEARQLIATKQRKGFNSMWKRIRSGERQYSGSNTLAFYKRKGMTDSDARDALKIRQSTRSLDFMIRKYGEDEGRKRFNLANSRWLATLDAKTDEEKREILIKKVQQGNKFFSKWSQNLIHEFLNLLADASIDASECYFGEDEYFIYDNDFKKVFFYDLILLDYKICIEFNGSHVHPHREKMNSAEWLKWIQPFTKESADTCYEKDLMKLEAARKKGFEVFIVWDSDDKESKFLEILNSLRSKI